MGAQSEGWLDKQCKDRFLVQSIAVREGTTIEDLTRVMFQRDAANVVDEVNLKVVYIQPPRRPSPVREGSDEGPTPRPSWPDGENINCQDMVYDFKDLLKIEPNVLRFPFDMENQISCSVQLTNTTDDHIAFKVKNNNVKRYIVQPKISIVPRLSTCNINVTRKAQEETLPDIQCKDKFLVQSVPVREGTQIKDLHGEMFKKHAGQVVNEVKLKVLFVQPPSHVPEEFEKGSSSGPSSSDEQETESTLYSVPLQRLKEITNNFCDERKIGTGGFGMVYKGVTGNRKVIAVKKFMQPILSSQEQFENEVNLLRKLEHTNIVRLVGFCYETQSIQKRHEGKYVIAWEIECLLCLEYLPKGSLDKYISDASSGLDWPTRLKIIEGVSYGLQYLHEQSNGPIVHLDLKPANILLDENMIPKITDFCLSRLFDQKQTIHTVITCGTLGYMPPEYLRGIITPMSDIFSLGVLIMEIVTGHRDYPNDIRTSSTGFIELELQEWRNVLQKELGYRSLEIYCQQIKKCIQIGLLCVNPERTSRPTMKEIINMLEGLESMNWYISNELTSLSVDAT